MLGQGVGGLRAASQPARFRQLRHRQAASCSASSPATTCAPNSRATPPCAAVPWAACSRPLTTMGLQSGGTRRRRHPAARRARHGRHPAHCVRPARAIGAGKVGHSFCRAACAGTHHRGRAPGHARPYRAHARVFRRRAPRSRTDPMAPGPSPCAAMPSFKARACRCRGTRAPPLSLRGRSHLPGLRHRGRECADESDAHRLPRDFAGDGGRDRAARSPGRRAASRWAIFA